MPHYFVSRSKAKNGVHLVHKAGCSHMPSILSTILLRYHESPENAVQAAKHLFNNSEECELCCKD